VILPVQAVKARCDTDGTPLGGLINNAGIATSFGYATHDELVETVKVNLDGVVLCTQAFLPLLEVTQWL
jgi:NAD(P)-dependent dehydrogenase (short-subunit alcohol dehydrogenase family)